MKTATIEEFARSPEEMVRGLEAVMITEDGQAKAMLVPLGPGSLSMEERRKRYAETSEQVARELEAKGITQEQIDRDIDDLLRKDRG